MVVRIVCIHVLDGIISGASVVSKKSSSRSCHEFADVWSLEERQHASNLAVDAPDDAAISDRHDRHGVQEIRGFVKTVRDECPNHLAICGERHLQHVVKEFMAHDHRERFIQGLGGQLIEKDSASASNSRATGKVTRRSRWQPGRGLHRRPPDPGSIAPQFHTEVVRCLCVRDWCISSWWLLSSPVRREQNLPRTRPPARLPTTRPSSRGR